MSSLKGNRRVDWRLCAPAPPASPEGPPIAGRGEVPDAAGPSASTTRLAVLVLTLLASAVGRDWNGKLSPAFYLIAIPLAFVNSWIAGGLYVFVALLWLIPEPRIERELEKREE